MSAMISDATRGSSTSQSSQRHKDRSDFPDQGEAASSIVVRSRSEVGGVDVVESSEEG